MKTAPTHTVRETCRRCAGTGVLQKFAHIDGGRCFNCKGSGWIARKAPAPRLRAARAVVAATASVSVIARFNVWSWTYDGRLVKHNVAPLLLVTARHRLDEARRSGLYRENLILRADARPQLPHWHAQAVATRAFTEGGFAYTS